MTMATQPTGQAWRRASATLALVAAACAAVAPATATALVAQVEWVVDATGILTGARHVGVGGTLYDVRFAEGTCLALFNGCDANSDFTFDTAGAALAATALLQQVFVDRPNQPFDSQPALTFGCGFATLGCRVNTPMSVDNANPFVVIVNTYAADNWGSNAGLFVDGTTASAATQTALSERTSPQTMDLVWAVWSPSTAAVPEPSAFALGCSGLAALFAWRRRRARKAD